MNKDIEVQHETTSLATVADILNEMQKKSWETPISLPTIQVRQRPFSKKIQDYFDEVESFGQYDCKDGNITLFWDTFWKLNKDEQFFITVHELVHAFWNNKSSLWWRVKNVRSLIGAILYPGIKQQAWYANVSIKWKLLPKIEKRLLSFNEWITNKIAKEVIKEYNQRTWEKFHNLPIQLVDRQGMRLVNNLINLLALRYQTKRETITQALIQWYFSGLDLIETLMNPEYWLWINIDEIRWLLGEDL